MERRKSAQRSRKRKKGDGKERGRKYRKGKVLLYRCFATDAAWLAGLQSAGKRRRQQQHRHRAVSVAKGVPRERTTQSERCSLGQEDVGITRLDVIIRLTLASGGARIPGCQFHIVIARGESVTVTMSSFARQSCCIW